MAVRGGVVGLPDASPAVCSSLSRTTVLTLAGYAGSVTLVNSFSQPGVSSAAQAIHGARASSAMRHLLRIARRFQRDGVTVLLLYEIEDLLHPVIRRHRQQDPFV